MKFRVTGSNKETGARMLLELEAESKAAAERKAVYAGMVVNHAQEITEREPEHRHSSHRGEEPVKSSLMLPMLVVLAILAAVVWFFWPKIHEMMS